MTTYQDLLEHGNIEKHLVNWFKMNETSGNLIDSKGSALGTINGATRITGGGLKFDGSNDYVSINNSLFPLGEKTFYIKLSASSIGSNYPRVFANASYTNNSLTSLTIQQQPNGQFAVLVKRNSETNYLVTPYISDGLIHELFVTMEKGSTQDKYSLFVDDVFIQEVYTTTKEVVNNGSSRLGSMTEGTNFFKGEIYEIAVFNVDISKFSINKTLILSQNEYKTYNSGWQTVSTTTPSESQYLSDGIGDLSVLERKVQSLPPMKFNQSEILLQNGKLFTKSIDLNKYMDIRSINVEAE